MSRLAITLVCGLLLMSHLVSKVSAQDSLDTCRKIETCMAYTETECDGLGKREVCLRWTAKHGCNLLAVGSPGGATADKIDTFCVYADSSTAGPASVEETRCKTKVSGGTKVSYGIGDGAPLNTGSFPRPVSISGHSATCSELTDVCAHVKGSKEIKVTFTSTPCPQSTTTTTTTTTSTTAKPKPPQKTCECYGYKDIGGCSVLCGTGTKSQIRICDDHCPAYRKETKTVACSAAVTCKVPHWSLWMPWTACSPTCGSGTASRTRTRKCLNGNSCPGNSQESQDCKVPSCPTPAPPVQPPVGEKGGIGTNKKRGRRGGRQRRNHRQRPKNRRNRTVRVKHRRRRN